MKSINAKRQKEYSGNSCTIHEHKHEEINSHSHEHHKDHEHDNVHYHDFGGEDHDDSFHIEIGCSCGHDHGNHNHGEHIHEHDCHDNHDDDFRIEIGCSCGHNHGSSDHSHEEHGAGGHSHGNGEEKLFTPGFSVGIAAFIAGVILHFGQELEMLAESAPLFICTLALFAVSYICIGKNVLLSAVRNISRGEVFDENFLMMIASLGAFCIGEFPEAVAVMLFYNVGEFLQDKAVAHSTRSIEALLDIRVDEAELLKFDGSIVTVPARNVLIGETIVIKPGAKIPLDGIIIEGSSSVNMQALTGESMPVDMSAGDEILSGTVNGEGELRVKVTKEFGESTASKILDLVRNAGSQKAKTENFITKFAKYYTPAVVAAAVIIALAPPLLIGSFDFATWVYRALIFLVVSCPCALVVSIPLSFFSGIGAASKQGIMVKGGNYLEALSRVETVVFDKTGTLTTGKFTVSQINAAKGFNENDVLEYAAAAESNSTHPIAVSIMEEYKRRFKENYIPAKSAERKELAGYGMEVSFDKKKILAGNLRLMEKEGVDVGVNENTGTCVYVAADGRYAGCISIQDTVKEDSGEAIKNINALGINKVVMLTGDNKEAAQRVASGLGITEVHHSLMPQDKIGAVEKLCAGGKNGVIFVGDGINDAPSIARADVGIAMGGVGSDAAIEAADIVIMTDQPSKIPVAVRVARKTKRIVWQNIVFALAIKLGVMILAAAGFANMWEAVFADVGVALLCVLNSLRIR
ncbi:MAG: cadmium-translocating P-type ATPase [Firmicutes bacterium]|nr:cadmium-translocating P-type ATPase [Bacillota bacterium]